jgi:ribosomal protein S18 acetylase RimI-like enzyme
MSEIVVRSYQSCDRSAIRRICCETADKGGPIDHLFRDRELVADLVTSYYTDYEPSSVWVAQSQADVVGYLTGCLDTVRYRKMMVRRIAPVALLKALRRGTLMQSGAMNLVKTWIKARVWRGFWHDVSMDTYPAHFHVNVLEHFRDRHVGQILVEGFIRQAKEKGLGGIYLAVRSDNASARAFFEQMGFSALGQHSPSWSPSSVGVSHKTIIYGKSL